MRWFLRSRTLIDETWHTMGTGFSLVPLEATRRLPRCFASRYI